MLFAVGAEPDWSDFPFKGLFVPLLLRSVSYVAQEQAIMEDAVAGSGSPSLERLQVQGPVTVHTPQGNTIVIPTLGSRWAGTGPIGTVSEIGIYDVKAGPQTVARFVVNGTSQESLLQPLNREDVGQRAERAGFDPGDLMWVDDPGSLGRVITQARLGAELWHLAVIAALVVALLELALARERSSRKIPDWGGASPPPQPTAGPTS
jgi:hypothetical protein